MGTIVSGSRVWMAVVFLAFISIAVLLFPGDARAQFPQSNCKQHGGTADCFQPYVGPYSYNTCSETGSFGAVSAAWCQARGGVWAHPNCFGGTPRPRTESDIVPYAQDFIRNWSPPCSGPSTPSLPWMTPGQSVFSNNCWSGSPGYVQGWETWNSTNPWALEWTTNEGSGCTFQRALGFLGSRARTVECAPNNPWTSGGTATRQLCIPLHAPRQTFSCSGKGDTTIGNPCDPAT